MTREEERQAKDALKQWFASQDIMPANAGCIMIALMAEQLVAKVKEEKIDIIEAVVRLDRATKLANQLLIIEIGDALR